MPTGIVKWFNHSKGYGFIAFEDGDENKDIFVHFSAIAMSGFRKIEEGQNVNFDIKRGPKGLQASNVRVVGMKSAPKPQRNIKTNTPNRSKTGSKDTRTERIITALEKMLANIDTSDDPASMSEIIKALERMRERIEILCERNSKNPRTPQNKPAPPQRLFKSPLDKKPYRWQSKAIDAWEKAGRTGIVEAVTGSGKTFVAIAIAKRVIDEGGKCLVIVPSITLFHQWRSELERHAKGDIRSMVGAGHGFRFDPNEQITLAVINSVAKRSYLRIFNTNFDLIVVDECHRSGAPDFRKALLPQATMRLGLTATLERGDNGVDKFISPYFAPSKKRGDERKAIVFDYGFKEAIKDKVVSKFVAITLTTWLSDEERLEYDRCGKEMKKARDTLVREHGFPQGKGFYSEIRKGNHSKDAGILISKYNSNMSDRRKILGGSAGKIQAAAKLSDLISSSQGAIVYCADIKACDHITRVLDDQGIDASAYHTKIDRQSQAQTIHRFKNNHLQCVVAVNMLDEGIDIPHANLAIILSSSRQKRQLIQRLGRILRKKDDDSGAALVICYADETSEDPYQENEENDSGKLGVLNLAIDVHKTDLDDIDIDRVLKILRKRIGWKG